MSVFLQQPGILTTVQDFGRNGFRRLGINPNGAMDKQAARLINILLGNDENSAVLEMHFPAPTILFEEDAIIAFGGADFSTKINEQAIENWRPIFVEKGSVIRFTRRNFGARLYLSIKGSFEIENWLGSASTNLRAKVGGFEGRAMQKGDRINFSSKFRTKSSKYNYKISHSLVPQYNSFPKLRVIAGAEWESLTEESQQSFLSQKFAMRSESDRMGFRLKGEAISLKEKIELVSSAVDFGTIQLLPDGQLIILMADHQTTGGYPRVGNVASFDLPLLAQLNPNDQIGFEIISLEEAEKTILQSEKELNFLRTGIKLAG